MPDLSALILPADVYKVTWVASSIPAGPSKAFTLQTAKKISWTESAENELIHAIGYATAIGNENNAFKYSGKLSMQVGEMQTILKILGFSSAIKAPTSILAITMISGTFNLTFNGLLFHTRVSDINAKDKESIADLDWSAIDMASS